MTAPRRILVAANASWNLLNYRLGLINSLRDYGHEVILIAPQDETSETLREMGYQVITFQMSRHGRRALSEIQVIYRLFAICRSIGPDVILSFTTKCNVYLGLVARLLSIPFLPNVCGRGSAFSQLNLLHCVIVTAHRVAFAGAFWVFFQNAADASFFFELGIVSPERCDVLPGSGVELARFKAAPLPERTGAPVVLMIARVIEEKGVREFAEAARLVKERHPEAKFVLAGRHDESEGRVSSAELNQWIRDGLIQYRGEVTDVRPLIEDADIAALPSYYLEGTPRALIECAAMGRPIVTTNTPGCRDTLIPDITGLLVRPRDSFDLAEKLLKLIEMSSHSRASMGAEARRHVERHFDERVIIDAYITVLRERLRTV